MEGEQLAAHGGIGKPEFDLALYATKQSGVIVLKKKKTFEPIEPSWCDIKQ
jgi:hypothetical protein